MGRSISSNRRSAHLWTRICWNQWPRDLSRRPERRVACHANEERSADEDAPPIVPFCTTVQLAQSYLLRQFQRADVLDHRLAPPVDVRPLAVANTVLVTRHVDHVTLPFRAGHGIVSLFVSDDNQAVVLLLLVQALH